MKSCLVVFVFCSYIDGILPLTNRKDAAMTSLPSFRPGRTAREAHLALQSSVRIMDQARHCAVLWFGEVMSRGLYRELGYSSMRTYALEGLGFSSSRCGDFMRLAEKLETLPAVKAAVASGRLGYTKAREIVAVADPATEKEWLEVAHQRSRRELVAAVRVAKQRAVACRQANPAQGELVARPAAPVPAAAVPVRVSFDLSPAEFAQWEALLGQIGHRGSKAELLLAMAEALADGEDVAPRGALVDGEDVAPRGATVPRYQIHVHECATCGAAAVVSPQGEQLLDAGALELAHCDATVHQPGQRAAAAIPPRVRREVLARDRLRCRRRGCGHTRHLDIHHLVPRHRGGGHEPDNLVTLCTACHRLWHERGGDLSGLLIPVNAGDSGP
jgi:hypothetical protein